MLIGRFPLSSYVHSAPGSYAQSCCKCLIGQVSQGKGEKSCRFSCFNIGRFQTFEQFEQSLYAPLAQSKLNLAPVKYILKDLLGNDGTDMLKLYLAPVKYIIY